MSPTKNGIQIITLNDFMSLILPLLGSKIGIIQWTFSCLISSRSGKFKTDLKISLLAFRKVSTTMSHLMCNMKMWRKILTFSHPLFTLSRNSNFHLKYSWFLNRWASKKWLISCKHFLQVLSYHFLSRSKVKIFLCMLTFSSSQHLLRKSAWKLLSSRLHSKLFPFQLIRVS